MYSFELGINLGNGCVECLHGNIALGSNLINGGGRPPSFFSSSLLPMVVSLGVDCNSFVLFVALVVALFIGSGLVPFPFVCS